MLQFFSSIVNKLGFFSIAKPANFNFETLITSKIEGESKICKRIKKFSRKKILSHKKFVEHYREQLIAL